MHCEGTMQQLHCSNISLNQVKLKWRRRGSGSAWVDELAQEASMQPRAVQPSALHCRVMHARELEEELRDYRPLRKRRSSLWFQHVRALI